MGVYSLVDKATHLEMVKLSNEELADSLLASLECSFELGNCIAAWL